MSLSWAPPLDPCWSPTSTGCPCDTEGESLACGSVHEQRGEYVICSMGVRVCNDGAWGDCAAENLVETSTSDTTGPQGLRLQALTNAVNCLNLCQPDCMLVADKPSGVPVANDLVAGVDGITLPGSSDGGNCNNLIVAPAAATLSISAINANGSVVSSPATLTFSGTCSGGAPVTPSWSTDAYDRSVIDAAGKLTVFSGVASPIIVTAASSADTTPALVSVVVKIEDRGTVAATALLFDAAGTLTDSAKTLYPYKNTVFPLDLKAPLVQWQTGGTAATDVQVALRFPNGCVGPTAAVPTSTCSFWYSKIYNATVPCPTCGEPTCTVSALTGPCLTTSVPSWQIPQEIWSAFDRSAAGNATGGEIIIQRRYGGTVRPELKIPVKFATASLHGTAFYTQYGRTLTRSPTSLCTTGVPSSQDPQNCSYLPGASYAIGQTCPVGNVVKPIAVANISMTRAIDLSSPAAVNSDPFNNTAGCPVCHSVSADGKTYVSSSQVWQEAAGGTSKGIDTIGIVAGAPRFTALGTGESPSYTGLNDDGSSRAGGDIYNNNERTGENSRGFAYAAITPDGAVVLQGPNFWGNTLNVPASESNNTQDGTQPGLSPATESKPYFFAKTALPGFGVQFATTTVLPANTWSATAPASFTATTSVTLTLDGFTLNTVGQAVLVKNEATAARNGVYSVTATNPWRLARRYDADAAAEIIGNMEVRVSDGAANRGKIFYVSSPGSGPIATLNTTNIVFSERVIPGMQFTSAPLAVQYATAAALPSNNRATNVLTATANGAFPGVDGVAVALNGSVLVKNETLSVNNGVYTLTTLGTGTTPWKLTRRTDADSVGEFVPGLEVTVSLGSTNTGKVFYISSSATGATITINTTALTFSPTELPAMMVPVFSPDGTKVAYVNADADATRGLPDTGWRRGLSMFSFNQASFTVSNKKRLLNTYSTGSAGIPMKWPFFEHDSRSLLYVETETGEFCSTASGGNNVIVNSDIQRACYVAIYGSMSPTTRGYWQGRVFSIDTGAATPSTTRVELAKLNDAEDAADADHAYQPTVLPFSAGGYRWVIFTSPRAFGNQLNGRGPTGTPATHFSCEASMLWVSALADRAADGTDRSNPAFLLPGQNMKLITTDNHYINERGYLVPTQCKAAGISCTSNGDCCGFDALPVATAACRAPVGWTSASGPPAKICAATGGTCSNAGGGCNTPADCCNGRACVDFKCAAPPIFTQAVFTRDYAAACPPSYQPHWDLLSYHLTTPGDTRLEFRVQTANLLAGLATAPLISLGQSTNTVVLPAPPEFKDVGAALDAVYSNGLNQARVTVTLVPSSDALLAPTLNDWEMRYTCQPAQ